MSKVCVFQDWMFELPMQQQSVLVLACRGPDGIEKFHPCKKIVTYYRATVLKAAYRGRALEMDEKEGGGTFMTLGHFSDDRTWLAALDLYFDSVDNIPHHYHMHLMHGAQIAGYKHPNDLFRSRWCTFYYKACEDLHLYPETEAQMDARLGDWGQVHWNALAEKETV